MDETLLAPLWEHVPGWQAQVEAWIVQALGRLNRQINGPIMQSLRRPWSYVLQVPTEAGMVYFKAVAPHLTYEAALTHRAAAWRPDLVLAPLAVDEPGGWLLLPDGGGRLREAVRSQRNPAPLQELLPQYAGLQIDMAAHVQELIALGVPDRRLARLPELYAGILEDLPMLRVGQENGLRPEDLERLHAFKPRLAELCTQLAAYPIPETLHHGDLNDANVFYNPAREQDARFLLFDWGDSSLSHPFFSMRTVLVSLEISMDWEDEDPRGVPFVDVYLQAWQGYAGLDELRAAYQLARPLAALVSALSWQQAQRGVPEVQRMDYSHAVPSLLQEFLILAG